MADRKARIRAQASVAKRAPATPQRKGRSAPPGPGGAPDPGRALVTTEPPEPELDANGFNPEDYDWIPVKRVRRNGAWNDSLQRSFIEILADTGSVTEAAREVGMSTNSCYRLRNAPGGEGFARAWDAAVHAAANRLVDVLFDRAFNGVEHIVFDKHGRRLGAQRRYNDRMAMQLVRAHLPERYGLPRDATRAPPPAPPPAPPALSVDEALVAITPVTPPDPHLRLPPERLETEIQVADLMEGKLPRWYRDAGPIPEAVSSAAFEAKLEELKHQRDPLPPCDYDEYADHDPLDDDDDDDEDDDGDEDEDDNEEGDEEDGGDAGNDRHEGPHQSGGRDEPGGHPEGPNTRHRRSRRDEGRAR